MKAFGLLLLNAWGSLWTMSLRLVDSWPLCCLGGFGDSIAIICLETFFSFWPISKLPESILVRAVTPTYLVFSLGAPLDFSNMILLMELILDAYRPMLVSRWCLVALLRFSSTIFSLVSVFFFDNFCTVLLLDLTGCSLTSLEVRLLFNVLLYSLLSAKRAELKSILVFVA